MRTWTLVLLDIDGTLIELTGAGTRAMERALRSRLDHAVRLPPITFAGRTDRAIVSEIIATSVLGGTPPDEASLSRFFDSYLEELPREIAKTPHRPTSGALEFVATLKTTEAVKVGLATGNIAAASRIKLESAGFDFDRDFDFGAHGDEATDRAELLKIAIERGVASVGQCGSVGHVVVIGDTPHDVKAARDVGATSVAVSTGPYTWEQLEECRPDLLARNLRDVLQSDRWYESPPRVVELPEET